MELDDGAPQNEQFGIPESDQMAFADAVVAYGQFIEAYCARYASDAEEARDLAQEAWLRGWERRASFRGDGSFAGWMIRVARTVCTHKRRSIHKRTTLAAAEKIAACPPMAEDTAAALDALDDDRLSLILSLPLRQRRVVLLRLCVGLSTADVATDMNCSPGTVKATLHQALQSLRRRAPCLIDDR